LNLSSSQSSAQRKGPRAMPWILRTALLLVAVSVLLSTGAVAHAGQEKVEVCHITGTATVDGVPDTPVGHVISVAAPAYRAHIAHGDPEQWNVVTLDDGRTVCTPVAGESARYQPKPGHVPIHRGRLPAHRR
jgi:hypothetical protein